MKKIFSYNMRLPLFLILTYYRNSHKFEFPVSLSIMKLLSILFLLLSISKIFLNEKNEEEIEQPDVPYIDVTNFTKYLHEESKYGYFVQDETCKENEPCAFTNYSNVAKVLKGKIKMAWMNATISRYTVEEYTKKFPCILYYYEKTGYLYNGSFNYEDILQFFENFIKPEFKRPKEEIIYIDSENFDSLTKNLSLGVVMSYDKNSNDSRHTIIVGNSRTIALQIKKLHIPFFLIYCKENQELCKKLTLAEPLMIKFLRKGIPYPFSSDQTGSISEMVHYITRIQNFGSSLITSYKQGIYDMNQELKYSTAVFIAIFESEKSEQFEVYTELVHTYRDKIRFFHTFNKNIAKFFGCPNKNCLIPRYNERLTSPYDIEKIKNNIFPEADMTNMKKMIEFMSANIIPLVGQLSAYTTVKDIYNSRFPKVMLYMDVELYSYEYKETLYYLKILWKIAPKFPEFTFAIAERKDYETELQGKKLLESKNEVDLVIETANSHFYIFTKEFNEKNILDFLTSFRNDTIRPNLDSAKIPEKEYDENGIRILVAENFDGVVFDDSYDMIILFYVNWCKYCKEAKPIFAKLAQKYKNNKKLIFAKFDCEANKSPPEYDTSHGFPTIYFAPSNAKKNPIKYNSEGGSTFESYVSFIERHWTFPTTSESPLQASEDL